jgi:Tfp pilus assembly protein PilZ
MLLTNDVTLRRDELSEVLALSPRVIDALIRSSAVETTTREGTEVVPCAQLERVFRDSLLRLYQAQATRGVASARVEPEQEIELELPEAVEEELPVITRTSDEHLTIARAEPPELRRGDRYVPRRQLGGTFREVKLTVLQISSSGLRIRTQQRLQPGEEARLSFAIQNPPKSFVMRARVVWTSIAQRGDGPTSHVSGIRVIANEDRLMESIDLLRAARELILEETPKRGRNLPLQVSGLADEDVVAIIRAVRKFAADPTEATRWYTRARFAIADPDIRGAAPRSARDREEVVGIWEYLQRRVDLRALAGVVQWIRNSQVAAM